MRNSGTAAIMQAFENTSLRISIPDIIPLRILSIGALKSVKYAQIEASINEVGVIEPPVVFRDRNDHEKFYLLDGHIRVDILKKRGDTDVVCLIATDDEAFTYNKRVNRIAIVQEYKMILKAIEKGVPESRIAKALNVNIESLKRKKSILNGICPEALELIKDKHVPINTLKTLKMLKPVRQLEAVGLMIAMNRYSITYARSLVAGTPESQLVSGKRQVKGLDASQLAQMENETAKLEREFRAIEQDYGADHLDLVLITGFISKLLSNVRVVRYLAANNPDFLTEFQKIAEMHNAA